MAYKRYRDNVCAVIRKHNDNSVLVCHRNGSPEQKGWQFPQGGIDIEKDLIKELKRELLEEIGIDDISVIRISQKVYTYNYPEGIEVRHKKFHGQKQRWILAELNSDDKGIHFPGKDPEFDAYKWVCPYDALCGIVDFKKKVYQEAMADLGLI